MITKLLRARPLLASAILAFAVAGSASGQQPAQQPAPAQSQTRQAAAPQQIQQRAPQLPGYLGNSFMQIADVSGEWRGADHRGWVRIDGHYWQSEGDDMYSSLFRQGTFMPVPGAPRSGAGSIVLSLRKDNPTLPVLMQRCTNNVTMPEVRYSVSAERSNRTGLRVPRPADMPEYFDFTLRNVQIVDCPVVSDAPEQALVVRFSDIQWLNWTNESNLIPVTLEPAQLMPLPRNLSGETRSWVLTWFALAHDVSADQCPVMNLKPTEEDYYRLVPPEEAARERVELASEGGVGYDNGLMGLRGPHRLNAGLLPGIVADPGQHEPNTTVARGLNLDGDASSRRHRNYVSEDGRTGIDNQLYTVMGCNAGWSGHTGFMFQYNMEAMRNGQISILVQVDGVDNERNDREVYVTMLYSQDDMAKNGAGSEILPDYTFRASTNPEYTHYFQRVRGRIVDGVITTEPVDMFRINAGRLTSPRVPGAGLADGRMRLEIRPDGTMRGVLAGYADWRQIPTQQGLSLAEFSQGFQVPALYNSLRRNADGLRDPVTGEFNGISAAYDMEGVPAFVTSATPNVASVDRPSGGS